MLLMLLIANAIAPTSIAHPLYSEDDTTEVNISKQVEVTADQTIILVVRNPKKTACDMVLYQYDRWSRCRD